MLFEHRMTRSFILLLRKRFTDLYKQLDAWSSVVHKNIFCFIKVFYLPTDGSMLPHNRIVHSDVINVTLARLICTSKLLDDGRRPKHVGAILM